MNRQLQIVALGVAALAVAGGGFVAGMTVGRAQGDTQTAASTATGAGAGAQARRALAGGAGGGGAGVAGQGGQIGGRVISVGDGSITVELRQPGGETARSVIALVGGSTRVVRTVETQIALGDVKPGDQVLVVGQPDQATGTIAASTILVGVSALQQIFGGGGAGGPGASPGVRRLPSPSPTSR